MSRKKHSHMVAELTGLGCGDFGEILTCGGIDNAAR